MAVLLPNCLLGVKPVAAGGVDAHGDRAAPSWAALKGPSPGRAEEGADVAEMGAEGGRTWVLALDPALWPVYQGDLAVEPATGRQWLVVTADLITNNADAAIDYVRAEGHARLGAATYP